jgi:hypothetical protein
MSLVVLSTGCHNIRAVTSHPLTPNLALIYNGKQGKVKRWIFWERLTLR